MLSFPVILKPLKYYRRKRMKPQFGLGATGLPEEVFTECGLKGTHEIRLIKTMAVSGDQRISSLFTNVL